MSSALSCCCWISLSLAVFTATLSSVAGQESTQDDYIKNITGVDFSGLSHSLELYSESELYRVAGSVCRVVAATRRGERILEQPHPLPMNQDQLASLQLMVIVGVKVQETACAWFNAMFGGVAEESGECSDSLMTDFCHRVHIVNTYLDIYGA